MKDHEKEVKALAEALMTKETLDLKDIVEILGERPFPAKSNYKAYLETKMEFN